MADAAPQTLSDQMAELVSAERAKAQRFFASLAAEMRKPSFGEQSQSLMRALLLRAQEAQLYRPEEHQ